MEWVGGHGCFVVAAKFGKYRESMGLDVLDGGENDAAAGHLQQFLQMPPVFGLHRLLSQQLHGSRKRVEQLVVQIIAVGDDNDGGVIDSWGGKW